jgi:hypothetical protein
MPQQLPTASGRTPPPGTWLVVGLLLLGIGAAITGVWFQRQQTRRCLGFYGAAAARRIATAPRVELLLLRPGSAPGRLAVRERFDVSQAPGLVHLRRGLVEDANFGWRDAAASGPSDRLPLEAWDAALVFSSADGPAAGGGESTALVIDFDQSGGALTVVGQPGRIGLGRLAAGLEKWIGVTRQAGGRPPQGQEAGQAR